MLTKNNPFPNSETCNDFEYSLCFENKISKNCVPTNAAITAIVGTSKSVDPKYVAATNAPINPAITMDIASEM